MRVPLEWLRRYCAPDVSVRELEQALTISGTKVEAIHHHGVQQLERFVVGKVLTAEQHPDADRLKVCTVDIGADEPSQIVCGAPNVAAGQTVGVATPGAVLPGNVELKRAKLRGQESNGMILAEDELGIGADHAGIMELDDGLRAGAPLAEALPLATEVIEFEITPNRPDCLGVYGIAREVHAATSAPLEPAPWADDPGSSGPVDGLDVEVRCGDLCPRFTARVFTDVRIGPSPPWLKARLSASGMRPINNVVDITNYVMLLTGQPLHAFDLDRIAGGRLTIRRATAGEQVQTLDGELRELDAEMVVIEDAQGPTSIAGVMGGARSEVSPETTRVALEVATWIGHNIKRTSGRLALRSEASARFEKGLAPEQADWAQAVATQLMIELAGATVAPGTIDAGPYAADPWPEPVIGLRQERVRAVLGMEIAAERQRALLEALGFGVGDRAAGFDVRVPAFRRNDVSREADLIEEIARFELDRLPATLPSRRGAGGRLLPEHALRRRALDALVAGGALEAVGWSFADPGLVDRLRLDADDPRRRVVRLANPMSEEQSVLRTTLLGSLLDVARFNAARAAGDLLLCEQGAVYLDAGGRLPDEHRALAALAHGAGQPNGFFAMKALLATVLDALRVPWQARPATEPFLHPGRGARLTVAGEPAGWLGELHPSVTADWDLGAAAAFELDIDLVVAHATQVARYAPLSDFPAVRRDVSFWIAPDTAYADLAELARTSGGELLRTVELADSYDDGGGRRSYTLRLEFRADDRTLTDDEVEPLTDAIAAAAADRLGARRRV